MISLVFSLKSAFSATVLYLSVGMLRLPRCLRCDKVGSTVTTSVPTGLLSLLEEGGLDLSRKEPAMKDLPALDAAVKGRISRRCFDFRFIEECKEQIIESSRDQTKSALSLLRNLSFVGYYSAEVTLAICIGLLQAHNTTGLSAKDRAEILGLMAKQLTRVPEYIHDISDGIHSELNDSDKFQLSLDLANLGMLDSSAVKTVPQPQNAFDAIRLCMAFVLSPETIDTAELIQSHFIPALHLLGRPDLRDSSLANPTILRNLQIIRYALRYCYPNVYASVPDRVREFLAFACVETIVIGKLNREDMLANSVSESLIKLSVRHTKDTLKGPFRMNIEEVGKKIVWECNSRKHFYTGNSDMKKTAYYELQTRVLKGMGYSVVQIPYWHWDRLRNRKARVEYLKMSRHIVLVDSRERENLNGFHLSPIAFDASNAALRLQTDQFLGDLAFRKEAPKRSWSWSSASNLPVRVSL